MELAKRKVLIVEDEFILYQELSDFFEEKGFYIIRKDDSRALDNYVDAVELLKIHRPDIAIIDIKIKGDKDGLELCGYIRKHFKALVVILSAYDNDENMSRAASLTVDDFVIKADKPTNKRQLWAKIKLALPKLSVMKEQVSAGKFLDVREIEVNLRTLGGIPSKNTDPVYVETMIKWQDITHIISYNSAISKGNNEVLMYAVSGKKGYIYRSPLYKVLEILPEYFVQFNQSTIVNLHQITAREKGGQRYKINDVSILVSPIYKREVQEKVDLIASAG